MAQKLKLKQTLQLQVREAGIINEFCYPYARLLLDKAVEMGDQLWQEGRNSHMLTNVAYSVLDALSEQIGASINQALTKKEAEEFIKNAKEFLAIFED